ncbi:MAG: 50S ribosomal protein L21e [Candidatus Micrarchaeota archaeon]|nr:50S ribosomal protein L21e [Candidatus Micrarchaeota archaeon]
MSRRSKGLFSGRSRHLARHNKPSKIAVREIIKEFKPGDKVAIVPKSNMKNIPHPRYKGKIADVIEKRGSAYVVELRVYNATKRLTVPGLHLKRA